MIEGNESIYKITARVIRRRRISNCWNFATHAELEKLTERKRNKRKITFHHVLNTEHQDHHCDNSMKKQPQTTCATKSVIFKSQNLSKFLSSLTLALLIYCYCFYSPISIHCIPEPEPNPNVAQTAQQQLASVQTPAEYQFTSAVGDQTHIPCLIGRQLYCGEPYFVAWYKLNTSSRSWARIEHKSEEELLASEQASLSPSVSSNVPATFNERVRFTWWRAQQPSQQSALPASLSTNQQRLVASQAKFACEQLSVSGVKSSQLASLQQTHRFRSMKLDSSFDCATLTINSLELADEGQYKCEITFSDSVDFDKCPATTLSRLSLIGKYPKCSV